MFGFIDALQHADVPVIMELKRRGAEGEDLFDGRSVGEIVTHYEALGAPCLSVVTGSWFGGDDELLREVAALTDRPLLKKDFVTNERQIAEAKRLGAAAVLLTAELLPGTLTARLAATCVRHGLTPFVEVASEEQLARLGDAHGCVVAVTNKDIRRRERGDAQIERSLSLLPAVLRSGAECAVSASGIAGPEIGARLLEAGYDALLVGTSLLKDADSNREDVRTWSSVKRMWSSSERAWLGSTAARRVAQAGLYPLVLEARDRVGGRTVNEPIGDGVVCEMGGVSGARVGTLHAFAAATLQGAWRDAGEPVRGMVRFPLRLLSAIVQSWEGSAPLPDARTVATELSWAKARAVSADGYVEAALRSGRLQGWDDSSVRAVAAAYAEYEREKAKRRLIDVDDLIPALTARIATDDELAQRLRWAHQHLYVDEFQDLGRAPCSG